MNELSLFELKKKIHQVSQEMKSFKQNQLFLLFVIRLFN